VIIGILSAIAYPSYTQYIVRGHRAAAQSEMMDIANRQQQYFLANRGYASSVGALSYTMPAAVAAKYALNPANMAVDNTATPPVFTITFVPSGSQASDGNLTLNSEGVKTPAAKWK
jgi:type IV pilus assembly protein PilE